jgi:hypothetical protein
MKPRKRCAKATLTQTLRHDVTAARAAGRAQRNDRRSNQSDRDPQENDPERENEGGSQRELFEHCRASSAEIRSAG